MGKESGQITTNFCEGDDEIEEAEQRESCLKEEFVIAPQVHEERKLSNASSLPSFDEKQEVLTLVFQYPFSVLLEASEENVLKAYLKLTIVFDLSGRESFQDEIHFSLASLLNRLCFLSMNQDQLINQLATKMLKWFHWIFHFS